MTTTPDDLASMAVEQLTHDIEVAITWMPTASGRRHTRAVLNELVHRLTEMERERERLLRMYRWQVSGKYHCENHEFYMSDCDVCVEEHQREHYFDENFS